jgi:RNA polymerase sigma-70 factor (ECF subfamily)
MEADRHQGLEALYRASRPELLRFLIARTGDLSEAEDILQELWIKLQQPSGGPIAHGRAYLYRMAQNIIVDRLRERHRRARRERVWHEELHERDAPGAEPADGSKNAEDLLLEREEAALLATAVANLPEGARRVFELHKLQGLSHAEIAHQLSISRSGVEKHIAVAMKYLRRAMMD